MESISDQQYASVSKNELDWWANARYTPFRQWHQYDKVFMPYYPDEVQDCVIDVGSGPVPILCNHNVFYRRGISVDPLNPEYAKIQKYTKYLTKSFETVRWTHELEDDIADIAFCLNTLDHVKDPTRFIGSLNRVLRRYGKLFLMVDIDKPKDWAHPHTITRDWLAQELLGGFIPMLWLEKKSWKFENQVLYFVGHAK